MNDHHFCKALLAGARIEAKKQGLPLPKGLRASRADDKHFYINLAGYVPVIKADCAYQAKAIWIMARLDRKMEGKSI